PKANTLPQQLSVVAASENGASTWPRLGELDLVGTALGSHTLPGTAMKRWSMRVAVSPVATPPTATQWPPELPVTLTTLPGGSTPLVGYQRRNAMLSPRVHGLPAVALGLKMSADLVPTSISVLPPVTSSRPSASSVWPEQKMLVGSSGTLSSPRLTKLAVGK